MRLSTPQVQRVLTRLRDEFPGDLTNEQLANRLGIPEPSMRRTTRFLETVGYIRCMGYAPSTGAIRWKHREDKMSAPSAPVSSDIFDGQLEDGL